MVQLERRRAAVCRVGQNPPPTWRVQSCVEGPESLAGVESFK